MGKAFAAAEKPISWLSANMHWLPPNGSLHGIALDHLLRWNLGAIFWLFIVANLLLAAAMLWRRKHHPESAAEASGRMILLAEVLPLLAITGLYIWMAVTGQHLWAASHEEAPAVSALPVEVTGVQFQWYFRYPGPDRAFGATRPTLVSAPAGNPLGLDPGDPRSLDDIVSPVLVLPAGRPVSLRLRSLDVIHGFFIPGMRLKQDTIPGMVSRLQFTPLTPGIYPILCSQVCGLGHARMQARLQVVSPEAFSRWLAGRAKFTLGASQASTGGGQP
jgi:cytochrome c oxidase subunit 2